MILSKKEGNMSLIMLFVLAIGSLIGLMSTNFIQDMISSTWSLRDFYQSYYISKWGIELWILSVNSYDYGFEDSLTGTEDIIRKNLHCKKNCNLSLKISSRVRPQDNFPIIFWSTPEAIDNCSNLSHNNTIIHLSGWASYVLPLFGDERKLATNSSNFINLLETPYHLQIMPESSSSSSNNGIGIGIALWSWFKNQYEQLPTSGKQELYITGYIWDISINNFLYNSNAIIPNIGAQNPQNIAMSFWSSNDLLIQENFNYLFITNLGENTYSFCLKAEQKANWYTLDNALVTSIASYGKTTIWLQANIKKPLPDYVINSYSNYSL
jgi:hypothetical protein